MMKVNIQTNDLGEQVFHLSGTIDETVDFNQALGKLPARLIVNTSGIRKINSVGIKSWMRFFKNLTDHRLNVIHDDLAVPLVEQVNTVQNFLCGAKVRSICLPYSCDSCGKYFNVSQRVENLSTANPCTPDIKCQKCGGNASFDDLPIRYFSFLNRA